MTNILLTGGTGYIGSHTAVSLIQAGMVPVLLDSLVNSSAVVVDRIEKITGIRPVLIQADVRETERLAHILIEHEIDAVIHFAALKAVGESVQQPLAYYDNNVSGLISVLQAMKKAEVCHIVLSSSATVYGEHSQSPMPEDAPLSAANPYGQTKVMMERIAADVASSDASLRYAMLRYFNPVGAHEKLSVFGDDYDTRDGTGERDYIHVMDLARGHVLAVQHLLTGKDSITLNLGTGCAVSVLEMIAAFEQASGQKVPYEICPRRAGDVASVYADASRAREVLGFETAFDVSDMCRDAWRWQSHNPHGYGDS